jgi:hypothetical protein
MGDLDIFILSLQEYLAQVTGIIIRITLQNSLKYQYNPACEQGVRILEEGENV